MHNAHDRSYKLLFSNPQMVKDLLKGFVHEDWVNEVDYTTLETVKDKFVSDDLREREDDIIWRVRHKKSWVYVYLLIEFQSTVDSFMAVRVPLYTLMLYQDLIRSEKIKKGGLLPPVFPVVLYNGSQRWDSATQLSDLIIDLPGGLERYKLESEYLILDEGTYSLSELEPLNNLVAAIFRLENSQSREDIIRVIDNLQQWLSGPEMENIRKSFVIWLKRVLMPTKKENEPIQKINDLMEIKAMLAQTVSKMNAQWIQQGQEIGEKKLLFLQIAHRFDKDTSSKAQSLITPIQSTKVLENIGQWLLDCKDGDEFLKLIRGL